jgi:hypothetical protein
MLLGVGWKCLGGLLDLEDESTMMLSYSLTVTNQVLHQRYIGQNCDFVCDILILISQTVQCAVCDQVCELAV